ncbi:uncharacterized protein LOC132723829 isoform X2 [Ruditapes philippinarum]|uniref:uncharacterized protein LOC132723829 isoform X2 n=1 Tax=Ruditapes philippinarum TaxID=129788 RepID=UPI00295C2FBC|nr:uncharacterized protein LOC132723829 isoform X2 [Ruditapes philippinarum]
MLYSGFCAFLLLLLKYQFRVSLANEPICSKFAYDEQLLEKMIRQEIKVETMHNDMKKTQDAVSITLEEIKKSLQNNLTEMVEGIKEKNEEILRNTIDELRNYFTIDMDKGIKMFIETLKKPSVAFFAHNVVDLKLDRTDKIIIFTTAMTNEGSEYDTSTGIFTAPVGGLYQFIINYCTPVNKHSPLALVLSGNVIARSSNYDEDGHTCSSFSAVIRVKSEVKVWVKCLDGRSEYALQEGDWKMSSFSGILVK